MSGETDNKPSFFRSRNGIILIVCLTSPLWITLILLWFLIALPRVAITIESIIIFSVWLTKTIQANKLNLEVSAYSFGTSLIDVICLTSFRFLVLFILSTRSPSVSYPSVARRWIALIWTLLTSSFLIAKLCYVKENWQIGITTVALLGTITFFLNENWLMTSIPDLLRTEEMLLTSVGVKINQPQGNYHSTTTTKRTGYNKLEETSSPTTGTTTLTATTTTTTSAHMRVSNSYGGRSSSSVVNTDVREAQVTLVRRFAGGLSYFETESDAESDEKEHKEETDTGTTTKRKVRSASSRSLSKPPLVLCHGYGAGKAVWATVIPGLGAKFHLYLLDAHGIGLSSRPRWTARRTSQAELFFVDALERWRSELGLENFILMGHSLGGYLAGVYCLKYPTHVKQLILASPVAVPDMSQNEVTWTKATTERKRRQVQQASLPWRFIRYLWTNGVTPPALLRFFGPASLVVARYLIRRRMSAVRSVNVDYLTDYLYHLNLGPASGDKALPYLLAPGAWAQRALGPRLLSITVPVGFIYGETDWMDSDAGARVLNELYGPEEGPKHLRIVFNAGHQLTLENPSSFVLAVFELVDYMESSKSTVIHLSPSSSNK